MSIFRAGLKKISIISGRKNPAHDHPTGRIGPQFSGWARAGPGLGRAARAFLCKTTKNNISGGARAKFFFTAFKISAHARPVRFVGGPGAGRAQACGPGRAGLKMLRYRSRAPAFAYLTATTVNASPVILEDERTQDGETAAQKTECLRKNIDRARRCLEASRTNQRRDEEDNGDEYNHSESSLPCWRWRCCTRGTRNIHRHRLEDDISTDLSGHNVYMTPKENHIVLNEEQMPLKTPGLRRLQALVSATATQANRIIDPSPLIERGEMGNMRRP
jgi:hypothetical protein